MRIYDFKIHWLNGSINGSLSRLLSRLAVLVVLMCLPLGVFAESSSANFLIDNDIIGPGAGRSTSDSYQLEDVLPTFSAGESESDSYLINLGTPVNPPAVGLPHLEGSSGPEFAQVSLSWSEAVNLDNATYEVGTTNTQNAPVSEYVYDSPTASLSVVKDNLSFSQRYFFIIRVKDGLGEVRGYSNAVGVYPQAQVSWAGSGGGSGGGGFGVSVDYEAEEDVGDVVSLWPEQGTGDEGQGTGSISGNVGTGMANIFESIGAGIKNFFASILPPYGKKQEPTLADLVPARAPAAMRGVWDLLNKEPVYEFALKPLPDTITELAGKFPQIDQLFKEVGIYRFQDLEKLHSASLSIPGLSDVLALPAVRIPGTNLEQPKSIRIAELTPELKAKIPTEALFTRLAGGTVDATPVLSVTGQGETREQIGVIAGKTMHLAVKPKFSARQVYGYLALKGPLAEYYSKLLTNEDANLSSPGLLGAGISVAQAMDFDTESLLDRIRSSFNGSANMLKAVEADKTVEKPEQEKTLLVLNSFLYEDLDGDGIYTADVEAPLVAGNYEIFTVIEYRDSNLAPKVLRMITVVDPEGYVYEALGGKEIRVPGAIVTLEWLNPEKEEYEAWPADEYSQENPQITDVTGKYSFLVPEGLYRLVVEAPGYKKYDGKPFVVKEGRGVNENIELRTRWSLLKNISWTTLFMIVIGLMLVYNFYKDRKRDENKIRSNLVTGTIENKEDESN